MIPLEFAWAAPAFTLIGAIVGATITAAVGWFESRRRSEHDRRRDDAALAERQRVALTDRASEFLAATYIADHTDARPFGAVVEVAGVLSAAWSRPKLHELSEAQR